MSNIPRVIITVPVYTAMAPLPLMHFLILSQETGRAEAAGKYRARWNVGGPQSGVALIRNKACEFALSGEATHLLLMDDDMCPPPGMLEHLLSLDLPIVAPIFFRDNGDPLVFNWMTDGNGKSYRFPMTEYPVDQVFEAPAGVGTGVMLIKVEVLRAMQESGDLPHFGTGTDSDLDFCIRAASHGFKTFCDSRVLVLQMGKPGTLGGMQWNERRQQNAKKN